MKHEHGKIDVIPNNTENYTSFSINSIPFLDSNQFMQTSLPNLASNLNETHFSHVCKVLEEEPQAQQHQTADDLPQPDASLLNPDDQMIEDMQDFRFVQRPPSHNQSDDQRVNEDLQLLTRKGVYGIYGFIRKNQRKTSTRKNSVCYRVPTHFSQKKSLSSP